MKAEVAQLMKDHPDDDWNTPDENGNTLRRDIVEHAYKNNFPNLEAAYRDYMWDAIRDRTKAATLKEAKETKQKQERAGVVSKGGSGVQSAGPKVLNARNLNYDQIIDKIPKDELGKIMR